MLRRNPAAGRVRHAPRRIRFGAVSALAALAAGGCGSKAAAPVAAPTPAEAPASPPRHPAFASLETYAFPGGPSLALVRMPASELAAVRLSIPLAGAYERAGVARVLELLVRPRLEAEAAAIGASVHAEVGEEAVVRLLVGAAADLGELVRIARLGVEPPAIDPAALDAAAHRVREGALAESETPASLIRRQLGAVLFPLTPTRGGEASRILGLAPEELRAFWRSYYRPDRMRAVVAGPFEGADLVDPFSAWSAPASADVPAPPTDTAGPVVGATQLVRPWVGVAWRVPDERTAELLLAARIVGDAGESGGAGGVRVAPEVWWSGGSAAFVLIGRGEPPMPADSLERRTRAALERLRRASAHRVALEAAALADDVVLGTRTVGGAATLVGELFDRTEDPLAASWFLLALESLDGASLSRLADLLERLDPTVVRLTP